MTEHLEQEGWTGAIRTAHDGAQSLNLLNALAATGNLPVLILVDLNMPRMGGLETIGEIKKAFPETMIIVNSTFYSPADKQTAIKLGALDCIKKPSSYVEGIALAKKIISLIKKKSKK